MSSLTPQEITEKFSEIWLKKIENKFWKTILLSILAGMFIALWTIFSITSISWLDNTPLWIKKLISWITFSLWLILVMIAGAELFTGNSLLIISKLDKKISIGKLIKNLIIVRIWNFVWALIIIWLCYLAWRHLNWSWIIVETIANIWISKLNYWFIQAICLWILCNILVCLWVRLAQSWKRNSDKILGIIFPITAFVTAGFEHSIANMFYLPYAYILKITNLIPDTINTTSITLKNIFINNLLPVTIWNIIWWMIFVWLIYWLIFNKNYSKKATQN